MLLDYYPLEFSAGPQPAYAFLSDTGNQITSCSPDFSCINKYIVGNIILLSVTFEDQNKNPVDPAEVTLYVRNPDYTEDEFTYASGEILKTGVGKYEFFLQNTQAGYYNYRFEGGGNVVVASDSQINSIPSVFLN